MSSFWCENCGGHIRTVGGYETRFCSDQCRTTFHNTTRKAQRMVDRLDKQLHELLVIADEGTDELESVSREAIQKMIALIHEVTERWSIICAHCGRHDLTHHGTKPCPDCQRSVWYWKFKKHIAL